MILLDVLMKSEDIDAMHNVENQYDCRCQVQ